MIRVSIIITCHNLERHVVRAINSCLNQSLPHDQYEIIIVDDGSTDGSHESISLYKGFGGYGFVRTKFLPKNHGVAYASNVGIKMAKGKYIVRVDGDDYIHRDFLKTMSEILDWNQDIGYVYCDLITVTGQLEIKHRKFTLNTFDRLCDHGAGVMFRKKYLTKIGGYNTAYRNCEDFDLIQRYNQKYKGYHLRLPYYRYFKGTNGLSSLKKERETIKKQILKTLEKVTR